MLPYPGGLFDQPHPALLRMELVRTADNQIEEAEEAKANAKAKADEKVAKRLGAPS